MGLLDSLVRPQPKKKAETGVGVSMVSHGVPLQSLLRSPEKQAKTALTAYRGNTYIRSAERAVVNRISTVPWWLEQDGERITDESPQELQGVKELLENPYRPAPSDPVVATPRTYEALRDVTIRHTGLVGYAFWYLVGVETLGFPVEILYINPARMLPATDKAGMRTGWVLDPDASGRGTPLTNEEVVPFYLEPPDDGFLPTGLVATALAKVELLRLGDNHAAQLLATGGRIPGMITPPNEGSIPDEAYQGLVRDLRSIMEDPNAAKRTLVLKGPVEFTETAMKPGDMQSLELMAMSGDDVLSLWGVPRSQIGYPRPAGIGDTSKDKDAESMWVNAVGPRYSSYLDTLQRLVLDTFDLGITVHIEAPEFDDKAPSFEMAAKAATVPMRAVERRALIGEPPFGDPVLDNAIWMPINMTVVDQAPEFDPGDGKARLENEKPVVALRDALTSFLREQADRIGAKLESNAEHISRKPRDTRVWWDEKRENEALLDALRPHVVNFAEMGAGRAFRKVRGKAVSEEVLTPTILASALKRLGLRIVGINATSRDRIRDIIVAGLDADLSPSEMGRALRGAVKPLEGDTVGNALRQRLGDFGSELRAETIARTEMRVAQNGATIDAFGSEGVSMVEMIDGDDDAECAARDGRTVSLEEAEQHMAAEHPNGTLDFAPVVNLPQKAVTSSEPYGDGVTSGAPNVNSGHRELPAPGHRDELHPARYPHPRNGSACTQA